MGETTSQFQVKFEEKDRRDDFKTFINEFSNVQESRYDLTAVQEQILSQMPSNEPDQLVTEYWFECEFSAVTAKKEANLEFTLEAGFSRHWEVFEPFLEFLINVFQPKQLLCLTDDSTTGEMLVTPFDGEKVWHYETGGDGDWEDSVYNLKDLTYPIDSLLDLVNKGLPLAPSNSVFVLPDAAGEKSFADFAYELQFELEEDEEWAEKVKKLVEDGSDLNSADKQGTTVLDMAIDIKNVDLTKFLLEHGADPNAEDKDGYTPLHSAVFENSLPIVSLLLEYGAEVDPRDDDGRTPFFMAASDGRMEIVNLLVSKGADIHVKDRVNQNGLHSILYSSSLFLGKEHIEIMTWLIDEGVDIHLKDTNGVTPERLALDHKWSVKRAFKRAVKKKRKKI
jgi:ankyrin repeat protein